MEIEPGQPVPGNKRRSCFAPGGSIIVHEGVLVRIPEEKQLLRFVRSNRRRSHLGHIV